MKILFELFFSFFKTGLLTFGGGYAMLPLLQDELVVKRKWIKDDELLNYFSLGQCTPGIIAVNVATFCGYKQHKTLGAIVATTAMVLPSIVIITLIASMLGKASENQVLKHILGGIKIGVVALLLKIVWQMGGKIYQKSKYKILSVFIFALSLAGLIFFKISAVYVVLLLLSASAATMLLKRWQR